MSMAKIGILTSTPSFNDNYGAVLQAYALQQCLRQCGHEPCDLVYRGSNETVPSSKKASPLARFKGIFLSSGTFSHSLGVIKSKRGRAERERVFKRFQREHLSLSADVYDYSGLQGIVDEYDAFICGSDQVWNPRVHGGVNDPGYFLQFACGKARTVAYAPSFGVSSLPDACRENLGIYVGRIDHVSVREDSGAALLADAGVSAPVVVDPTMLLSSDDYDEIAVRPDWLPERYLAVYKFGERGEYDRRIKETARRLGLPVVNIPAAVDPIFRTRWGIGPSEFLAIVRDAELVCTDSFHATVFSILYRTSCIVFPRDVPGSKKSMNSRMEGLLDRLGMKSCYVSDCADWDEAMSAAQDYAEAHRRLSAWRAESDDFLVRSLQGVGE